MLSCVNHFLPDTTKSSGIALTCFKLEECYKKLKENQLSVIKTWGTVQKIKFSAVYVI